MKQIKKHLFKAAVLCFVLAGITVMPGRAEAEESDFVIQDGVLESYGGSDKEVVIPKSVTEIGKKAFQKNKTIQKVTISGNVKKIGSSAFSQCSLKEVVILKGVKEIGKESFSGCSKLTKITIPGSVEKIGTFAFSDCAVKKLVIPKGVKTMSQAVVLQESQIAREDLFSYAPNARVTDDYEEFINEFLERVGV